MRFLLCRESQLCCALLAFFFDEFALASLERFQFLFRRLKKAVAWCYCQLRKSHHLCHPIDGPAHIIQILEPRKGSTAIMFADKIPAPRST